MTRTAAALLAALVVPLVAPAARAATQAENDLLVTAGFDRLRLPSRPAQVYVDALSRRVRVFVHGGADQFAAVLRPQLGRVCPRLTASPEEVALECASPRLDARIVEEGGKAFLDIRQLRGLPWKGDDAPPVLRRFPASACPGKDAVTRAECTFFEGDASGASKLLRKLADVPAEASFAALRLGDAALEDDDVAEAVRWWRKAGESGPWGRLAKARLCEIDGSCLNQPAEEVTFDIGGLEGSAFHEMELRRWRTRAFAGDVSTLASRLLGGLRSSPRDSSCLSHAGICRHLLRAAMERPSLPGADEALEAYLLLPDRDSGPLAVDLAMAASEVARYNGAPAFGAGLLAAVTARVPSFRQSEYLAQTLSLYLAGRDPAHARVIARYARTRLSQSTLRTAPWPELLASAGEALAAARPVKNTSPATPAPGEAAAQLLGPHRAEFARVLAEAEKAVAQARGEQPPGQLSAAPNTTAPGGAAPSNGSPR
ncbi:MAG: hypothetical protein RL199_1324 [Pseudomonadota bacterium]|jgi:hypothetical protein